MLPHVHYWQIGRASLTNLLRISVHRSHGEKIRQITVSNYNITRAVRFEFDCQFQALSPMNGMCLLVALHRLIISMCSHECISTSTLPADRQSISVSPTPDSEPQIRHTEPHINPGSQSLQTILLAKLSTRNRFTFPHSHAPNLFRRFPIFCAALSLPLAIPLTPPGPNRAMLSSIPLLQTSHPLPLNLDLFLTLAIALA